MNASTDHRHDPALPESSAQRVERIRTLARALFDSTILNTAASRVRCREMAAEMIQLLGAEDEYQQVAHPLAADGHDEAMQRLSDALCACLPIDQTELTRPAILSRRVDPIRDNDRSA